MAAGTTRVGRGLTGRQHQIPQGGLLLLLEPILTVSGQLLDLSSQKRTAGLQAVNFVNKLSQNKSIYIYRY